MSCEKGTPGIVVDIITMFEVGSTGQEPVAVVEHDWEGRKSKATVNIKSGQEISVGDLVEIHREQPRPNLSVLTLETTKPI